VVAGQGPSGGTGFAEPISSHLEGGPGVRADMSNQSQRPPVHAISHVGLDTPAILRKHQGQSSRMRVALVTEELSFGPGSGGIGGAFHELSLALARAGYSVDLLYLPINPEHQRDKAITDYYANHGVSVVTPDIDQYTWNPSCYVHRSYAIFRYLASLETAYTVIHFHDYKGLGFFSLAAKQQCLAFADTSLVVQAHGPTRWTLRANGHPFTHPDQLKIDFLERQSIARADILTSPSRFMLDWFKGEGWSVPSLERVHVLQNICTHVRDLIAPVTTSKGPRQFNEIVFFGRHEERKGIVQFCDTLDLIRDQLRQRAIAVSFLGGFGKINGEDSSVYLAGRARRWSFPISILADFDRISAARYLAGNPAAVVVIPSPEENSPYTVLEAAVLGKPLITSDTGGARELLDEASVRRCTCPIRPQALASKLQEVITNGLEPAHVANPPRETERRWIDLHEQLAGSHSGAAHRATASAHRSPGKPTAKPHPKVMAAITHFERPAKLYDAMLSLACQSYPNVELVVVDDGSSTQETLLALKRLQPLMDKLQIRLIRQENRYLGAARNRAVKDTASDYLLFVDDDDIAFPNLIQTLVTAAEATGADIVTCPNLYMPESRRFESYPFPDLFRQKISYIPTGGPLAMAPFENCLGAATALIRRTSFASLGGYTEDHGVGHEDFEFYVRALQAGLRIEVCPLPLYLYEVDRPSMASSTSRLRNASRIIRSIELGACPDAWQDLISVTAGGRAQEDMTNFTLYNRRTSPHAHLLQQIADTPAGSPEYATLVSEYASAVDARSFAWAMTRVATQRGKGIKADTSEQTFLPMLPDVSANPREPARGIDQHLLGSLIDLSFGRIAESIGSFRLSVERSGMRLLLHHVRYLISLTEAPNVQLHDLKSVLQVLRRVRITAEVFERAAAVIFRLAVTAREQELALSVLDRVLATEDQDYLGRHPDVADAAARGAFRTGLEHYERAGRKEGRPGFARLIELQAVLGVLLDTEPPLATLHHFVAGLNQAEQALPQSTDGTCQGDAVDLGRTSPDATCRETMILDMVP